MAILVQSFLNSATKLSTTATTATTVAQLKTLVNAIEGVSTSIMKFYIVNPSTTSTALVSGTLGSYGVTTATTIYSSNNISTATNKVDRQIAKLELAQLRRQAGGDTSATFYRSNNIYDVDLLADKYISNTSTVGTTSTLVIGRPWIQDQVYTSLLFNYGEATISFTLKANGTFENVTCPYGAGGYAASSGQIIMPGNQLIGGTTPANDIVWNYVCAANDGVITSFTYSSGTPP
jgi:hypothetical protein